ncbi:MAG: glutaredoxin family protein, partial [Pseudomonadota bacterium]|nr:glutaredoxin family protein [Pseudomonadota bacterium]
MTSAAPHRIARWLPALVAAGACSVAALPSQAQYKVIGSDGKVTYTDREPGVSEGRVVPLGARAAAGTSVDSELPFELRQSATKFPVTLYVTTAACEPCVAARSLLKQRGIPFSERMVLTVEDSDALEKLSGAREAPTLMIGSQTLRGLSAEVWNSYLDAAGYPRDSHLPATYQYRAATPIVERNTA